MIKKIYFILLILVLASSGLYAQLFEFSSRDAAKLPGRKLIVVLQEEREEVLHRIKKDAAKTARYKALIAYTNDLLKKTVTNFWRTGQTIEFRKLSECVALSDTSQSYMTIDFASLRINENVQLYVLKPDTANIYSTRSELMRRKEYGYFELKLIEKFRGTAFYTFHTPSSVPNEYDFITSVQFMSALVKGKLEDPKFSSRDYELKIQQNNSKLFDRILLADSNIVNKQARSYSYIRQEYDSLSLYELSNPKGIVEKIYIKDTTYAYLNILPYIDPIARGQSYLGTSGGNINDYEKTVYFMQLIFDASSGELLYYDKAEEVVVLARDWRRFLRFSRESVPFFQMPKKQEQTAPQEQQKKYQNQYQQNQY
jgi:hypothetical protein